MVSAVASGAARFALGFSATIVSSIVGRQVVGYMISNKLTEEQKDIRIGIPGVIGIGATWYVSFPTEAPTSVKAGALFPAIIFAAYLGYLAKGGIPKIKRLSMIPALCAGGLLTALDTTYHPCVLAAAGIALAFFVGMGTIKRKVV